ncbi:MAG: hypothetical protein RL685_1568 [Pseudomonadota bacterium]|jgi:hypothetical protein
MIRGVDNKGNVVLGLTRTEVEGLLAGKRCCFLARPPEAPGPHICIYFGETDEEALRAVSTAYPDGMPEPKDYRACKHVAVNLDASMRATCLECGARL